MIPSIWLLPQLLASLAEGEAADRAFLTEVDGPTASYRSVHARALSWAARLQELGVGEGDHVVTMLPTSITAAEVWLGLSWLRAVEVPVNTQFQGQLLSYVLENSGARLLVTVPGYAEQLAPAMDGAPGIQTIVVADGDPDGVALPGAVVSGPAFEPEDAAVMSPSPWPGPTARDISTMLYTSGTTGPSKGVLIPWAQMHATATSSWPMADLGEDDCFYNPFAMFHITGKNALYLMALVRGRVVLRRQFKTDQFWADIERYGCTTTVLMGVMANFLYRQPGPERVDTPLRNVLMAPLIPEVEEFKRRFGVRVCTVFNMTEVASPITSQGWDLANASSCGRPRPGYQCRLVDDDDEEVGVDAVGELVVRPDDPWTINAGYWGMPDKTVEAWRNLWFHTGDAFRRDDDGNYYYVDRLKDSIRRRGENISSLEIEREVVEHPTVLEVAAVGVPSEWGEEDVKIAVVAKPGEKVDPTELAGFLQDRLPRFMVPRYIEVLDALPRTPTEKIRKSELRAAGVTAETWDRLKDGT